MSLFHNYVCFNLLFPEDKVVFVLLSWSVNWLDERLPTHTHYICILENCFWYVIDRIDEDMQKYQLPLSST